MNKEQFMKELEKKLPNEEKEAALTYYEEYFEEAGKENESQVILELGDISKIANQIMVNFIGKESTVIKEQKNLKHSISIVWLVILSIFASPIALPFALVLILLILITWLTIIIFWISGVCLVLSGLLYSILFIFTLFHDIPLSCLIIGLAMISLGLGISITIGSTNLFVKYSSWITKKISKLLLRKEKRNEK